MGWGAVRCVEREQKETQNTPLWRSGAECDGAGDVGTESDRLWSICQEFFNPEADGGGETQVGQFLDQDLRDDVIECCAEV